MRLGVRRLVGVAVLVAAALLIVGGVAFGATQITTPGTSPFAIPGDGAGNPLPIDVVATGYQAGQNVFIEQCDGVDPSTPAWSVAIDCDFGFSPSPAIADNNGTASFVGDGNNFQAFKDGRDAQNKFNCIGPNDPPSNNGKTDYKTCRIRVASNASSATGDQTFLSITMPNAISGGTTTDDRRTDHDIDDRRADHDDDKWWRYDDDNGRRADDHHDGRPDDNDDDARADDDYHG